MWPFSILSILIIVIDRFLKIIIFNNIPLGESQLLLKGILHITPTHNKGIAFGLFKEGFSIHIIAASSITIAFIIYLLAFKRPKSKILLSSLFLILSGAFSNLIDRLIYGYVLDFIDIRIWPVFNIADSSITAGTVLLITYIFLINRRKTGVKPKFKIFN